MLFLKYLVFILLCGYSAIVGALEIIAVRQTSLMVTAPLIEKALVDVMYEIAQEHDFKFSFESASSERALMMLKRAEIPFNFARQQNAVNTIEGIIKLEPYISSAQMWLLASNDENCLLHDNVNEASLVSVNGVKIVESLAPKFKQFEKVSALESAFKMVERKRVDFTIWDISELTMLNEKFKTNLVVCGQNPMTTTVFSTYLHPDFAYMKPWIEEKYRLLQHQGLIGQAFAPY
jgi:hypothetical protein